MFLPFDIGEIQSALELAYKLIYIGWSDVHDAQTQYQDFKEDVEVLRGQLYELQDAIQRSRARTGALFAPRNQGPRYLDRIFRNLDETLNDCKKLLESRAKFGTQRGPVANYEWFLLVEDEVNMHRDRIAVLTSKLSLALQSLEVEMREGQTVMMLELADLLLQSIEAVDSRISRLFGEAPRLEPSRALPVPAELAALLESIAAERYGRATAIPMADGIEEAIFYLDQATRWHARRQQAQPREFAWASLLRASWVLQATKGSEEYRDSVARRTVEEFERQFPRLGMTTRRFFGKLEVRIYEAHAELARSGEVVPPVEQLREVVEEYKTAWQRHEEWRPTHPEVGYQHLGQRVASCRLRNANPPRASTIDIYRQATDEDHLTVVSGGNLPLPVDLTCVYLSPVLDAAGPSTGLYPVLFGLSQRHILNTLAFQGEQDLVTFQQWMTGYKVVDDYPSTTITTQRANRTLGGERRSVNLCRFQLWSSTRVSRGSQLPQEFIEPVPAPPPLGIVAPYPPALPALSFTQLDYPLDPNPLDAQAAPRRPSWLARASTITSSSSSTATLSTTASSLQPASPPPQKSNKIIQVDRKGTEGCILDQPDPPRIVVLLPDPQGRSQGPGSLLVIDINHKLSINPTRCACHLDPPAAAATNQQQPPPPSPSLPQGPVIPQGSGLISLEMLGALPTSPRQSYQQPPRQTQEPPPRQQDPRRRSLPAPPPPAGVRTIPPPTDTRCKKVVLQVDGGASGMSVWETVPGEGGWNLAVAGRYHVGALGKVKRVKKIVVEFGGVDERLRFVEFFGMLRKLYLKDLKSVAFG